METKFYIRKDGFLIFEARETNETARDREMDWADFAISAWTRETFGHHKVFCTVMVGIAEWTMAGQKIDRLILSDDNGEGLPGNMDHNKKRYHGWRGTTNDWAYYGYGLRQVKAIAFSGKTTHKVRIVFGPDLAKDKA